METVIVHFKNGSSHEVPRRNLGNVKRMQSDKIAYVEDPTEDVPPLAKPDFSDLAEPSYTEDDLAEMDKKELRKIAKEIAEGVGVKKPHHSLGERKLTEFILENQ